ncbi:hypothetical protein PV325_000453 [Microctonus aethiopoides]|nr:hypothetical protein PV325_000453 [Microctonus aethiopoides]
MDFFNHPYYVTIKNINCVFGAWPYQAQWKNTVCRCVITILFIIQLAGQMICFVVYIHDEESLIELIVAFLTAIFLICKFVNNMLKMTKLLESIKENQNMCTKKEEKHILDEEAQKGRIFVHGYLFFTYTTLGIYVLEPLTTCFANIIFYSNYTLPHIYPVPIHWYIVDMDKNFLPIWGLESICVVAIITSGLASDSSFFVFLQHARGLFILVQYQFRNLPNGKDLQARWNIHGNLRKTNDVQYDYYIMCIKHHKRAICELSREHVCLVFWHGNWNDGTTSKLHSIPADIPIEFNSEISKTGAVCRLSSRAYFF